MGKKKSRSPISATRAASTLISSAAASVYNTQQLLPGGLLPRFAERLGAVSPHSQACLPLYQSRKRTQFGIQWNSKISLEMLPTWGWQDGWAGFQRWNLSNSGSHARFNFSQSDPTTLLCLFIFGLPTVVKVNSEATSQPGHTGSPNHIYKWSGPLPFAEKTKILLTAELQSSD